MTRIPLAADVADTALDTAELRAAAALEPELDAAYARAGLHRRTPADVAADYAASRQRSDETSQRTAVNERAVALAYALAQSGRTGAL